MKRRHLPFAGALALALALAACPGPGTMSPAKPTEVTPLQKELPTPTDLADPQQIDPKDGKVLVLVYDTGTQAYLAYQADPSTCTVRRAFKIDPSKVGALLVPTNDHAGTLDVVRPNPPPPPSGGDRLGELVNLAARLHPGQTAQCQGFEPNAPVAK
jgi:hypothetical protein